MEVPHPGKGWSPSCSCSPPQPPQCSSVPCSSGWQKAEYCHVAFKLEIVLMFVLFWKVTLKAIKYQVTLVLMFCSSEFLSGKLEVFYELVIVLFHHPGLGCGASSPFTRLITDIRSAFYLTVIKLYHLLWCLPHLGFTIPSPTNLMSLILTVCQISHPIKKKADSSELGFGLFVFGFFWPLWWCFFLLSLHCQNH